MNRFAKLLILLAVCAGTARADEVGEALRASERAQRAARESQQRVDRIAGQIQELYQKQQDVRARALQMSAYATQLELQADSEEEKRDSVAAQIAGIDDTEAGLLPLVERMVADLEAFVENDLPFKHELRRRRVRELVALLQDPERNTADKFRRVLDAYRSEVDYGYSLGVEESQITLNGRETDVSLVRVGRLGLYFLTADGTRAGYWNTQKRGWRDLDDDAIPRLERALQVASGELPPELLVLPVEVPR